MSKATHVFKKDDMAHHFPVKKDSKKGSKKPGSTRSTRRWVYAGIVALFFAFAFGVLFFYKDKARTWIEEEGLETINEEYGKKIDKECKKRKLPPEYFKALIMLETSGKIPPESRFEQHIYEDFLECQRKNKNYGKLSAKRIKKADKKQLKQWATSWGPFQIMGYQAARRGNAKTWLAGDEAIVHGIRWVDAEYGNLLRKKRWKDAFHYHNTGKIFPKNGKSITHDPRYIKKGCVYLERFANDKIKPRK